MSKGKPNVLVFYTDQQRWDTAGIHGNPLNLTPNLDRLALAGTHLYHSFTTQPVCGPARACLQTGMYATTTGCYRNGIPLPESCKTLAHYFNEADYYTGYIGKWHLAKADPVSEEEQGGYQYWLGANLLEMVSDAYDTVLFDKHGRQVRLPGYRVDALTDAAIRFIDDAQHKDNPFFLFISYLEPHFQNQRDDYPAPDGYMERYIGGWIPPDLAALGGSTHQHIAGYYGMIKRLDEALGRIVDALKSLELLDDTIILFTSDHGCHFKTRNGEYKRSPHDSSIRVPTVLSGPGFFGGGRVQELISTVDLPPTLLDAAGIEVPEQMQGRSVWQLLNRKCDSWPEEVFVQISESMVARAIRTKRWKYCVAALDKDPWRDSSSNSYDEYCLYDLQADPYELRNLIGLDSHKEVTEVMRNRLLKRLEETGELRPEIVPAKRQKSGLRVRPEEAYM